jgi:hypothetical protein
MLKDRLLTSSSYAFGRISEVLGFTLKNPIFVLGSGRCGTTLLHKILKSNRQICIYPTEANELWHPRCYPYSSAKIKSPPILIDPVKFTKLSLDHWPERHENFIQTVFSGFSLLNYRCDIFIVKSAMISHMIPTILSLFHDARFIHIYRDGISVVDSLFKKERQKYLNTIQNHHQFLLACAQYWVACISEISRQDELLSLTDRNKLYQFSYEDLCSDPNKKLAELANFIGCRGTDFEFDYNEISSTNYKVGNYSNDKKWEPVLKIIFPTMMHKGYL